MDTYADMVALILKVTHVWRYFINAGVLRGSAISHFSCSNCRRLGHHGGEPDPEKFHVGEK